MPDFTLTKPADERELARFLDICSQALHFPRDTADRFAQITGHDAFRLVRSTSDGAPIVGGLAIHDMGQFFGGRSVRMGGVAAVGIAPEFRSAGAATQMMALALRDMRLQGFAISTLYPATVPLYRRAGYELAGSRYEITIPIRQLKPDKRGRDLRIERLDDGERDRARVVEFYTRHARHTPGLLDRGAFSWKRVYEPRGEKAQGYAVLNASGVMEGYAFLLQKDLPPSINALGPTFHLLLNDVMFATPGAGARLLELLRQHQSVCDTAVAYGSPEHPLLALIPERTFAARHQFHWMLRIVDVEKALVSRGWSQCVRGEVTFEVRDDVVPENDGVFTLEVADGCARVRRVGGGAAACIDVRGLAAMYSGHFSPHDLAALGWLRPAGEGGGGRDGAAGSHDAWQQTLETLGGLFAGPRPWMSDMF